MVLSNLAFVLSLLYAIIFVISLFDFYAPPSSSVPISHTFLLPQAGSVSDPVDYKIIKDWHLFGQDSSVHINEGEIKNTFLQIKLLGVFLWPNEINKNYAIIENEDKTQHKYHQGDELPNGRVLQSIDKEQVILRHNQQQESLTLDRKRTGLSFINK